MIKQLSESFENSSFNDGDYSRIIYHVQDFKVSRFGCLARVLAVCR